jgi:hypothetical protein
MRITCPYCHSDAQLSPLPPDSAPTDLPVYRLTCSGCDHTTVRPDNQELLLVALVGTRHGCGEHELTVSAEQTRSIRFHTDPTGQASPVVEHSALLEGITRGAEASRSFSLLLVTEEVGARFHSANGNVPYRAVRGWIVTDGDIRALSREEVWEVSCRDNDRELPLDPEAGVHYVDADAIPHPYRWQLDPAARVEV